MLQQRRPCTSGDGFLSFCIAVTRGEGPLSPMDRKKRKEVEVTVNQPIVVLEKKKKKSSYNSWQSLIKNDTSRFITNLFSSENVCTALQKTAWASLAHCLLGSRGRPFPVFLFCDKGIRSARSWNSTFKTVVKSKKFISSLQNVLFFDFRLVVGLRHRLDETSV